ncbi:MAG TPA: MarR family transcriptional regulator [Phycisphaerales bacterium]|nr:MarR family transcriptional regulator [Phycisphaerales bacterium]|tara:strand:- start:1486 stop:1956 length:471 start_codon:yes stop_codon:yes gene_type:complete
MQLSKKNTKLPTPGRWISAIHRMKSVYLDRELAPLQLNGATYLYLVVLDVHGSQMQDVFSKELALNKSCVTRSICRLEELGYVQREPDPNDGRAMLVSLSAKGKKIVPRIRQSLETFSAILHEGLTDNQVKQAEKLLMGMRQNLADHLEQNKAGQS